MFSHTALVSTRSCTCWLFLRILFFSFTYFILYIYSDPAVSIPKKEIPGQFDDAVENGKTVEKGQGDAPIVA